MSQRSIDELPLGVAKGDSLVPFADPATGIAYKISIKEFMLAGTSDDAGSVRAPVFLSSPVNTVADLPAVGLPGQLVIVLDKKSIYGWDDITGTWVNGGNIQGPAGETLKIQKSVDHANHLDAAPPLLTVTLVTHTKTLFIFDPTNAAAAPGPATPLVPASPGVAEVPANPPAGWVALGRIEGPPGPKGDKGDPGLVKGTVEGQILRWSVADDKWVGGSAPVVTPNGNANGDTLKWNGALNRWDSVGLGDVLPTATSNQILVFDGTANTWAGTSDLLDIGALSFTANTGGEMADQIVAGDFSLVPPADVAEDTSLVTVSAVRGYVDTELRLENISDCKELATAEDGQVPVWNEANNRWEPQHITSPIIFLGTGAHDPGNVASAAARYGMPADTQPDPLVFHALPGDQYIDLSTGNITVFTGTTGTGTRGTGASDISVVPTNTLDLSPPPILAASADFVGKPAPTDGQYMVWSATERKFILTSDTATKAWVESRVEQVVQGLSHGVAVVDIATTPPPIRREGELYIIGVGATGDWAGRDSLLTYWNTSASKWEFIIPHGGETHLVEGLQANYTFSAQTNGWVKVANASTASLAMENLTNVVHNPKLNGDLLIYSSAASKWLGAQPSTISGLIVNHSSLYQVGDLKQSVLTEAQFKTMLGSDAANWVLADGRDITGSTFATITGRNTVPDLRGAFLRMAGQNNNASWNGGTLNGYQEDSTARPKVAFTTDQQGNHRHSYNIQAWGFASGSKNGMLSDSNNVPGTKYTDYDGAHTHTITGGGDSETRPKTYSVNYFIKIN